MDDAAAERLAHCLHPEIKHRAEMVKHEAEMVKHEAEIEQSEAAREARRLELTHPTAVRQREQEAYRRMLESEAVWGGFDPASRMDPQNHAALLRGHELYDTWRKEEVYRQLAIRTEFRDAKQRIDPCWWETVAEGSEAIRVGVEAARQKEMKRIIEEREKQARARPAMVRPVVLVRHVPWFGWGV